MCNFKTDCPDGSDEADCSESIYCKQYKNNGPALKMWFVLPNQNFSKVTAIRLVYNCGLLTFGVFS